MSYKNKKLSSSKYKGRGLLLYQNLWHQSKLTKKMDKLSKNKVKVHSTELGRPLPKYRMLKTIVHHHGKHRNVKKYVFDSLPQTKKQMAGFHYVGRNQQFFLRTNRTKESSIMNKGLLNFYKLSKSHTKENSKGQRAFPSPKGGRGFPQRGKGGESFSQTFLFGNLMPSTTFSKGSRLHVKKNLRTMVKRLWFFDNAAPIPGVSSLKKKKRLKSTKLRSFKTIQSWYEILNKKQMKAFLRVQKKKKFSKNWNAILLMESMFQSNFRKRAFTLNRQQRNSLAYSQNTIVNGSFIKKLRFVNMRGDLTSPKNGLPVLHRLLSFYAPLFFLLKNKK